MSTDNPTGPFDIAGYLAVNASELTAPFCALVHAGAPRNAAEAASVVQMVRAHARAQVQSRSPGGQFAAGKGQFAAGDPENPMRWSEERVGAMSNREFRAALTAYDERTGSARNPFAEQRRALNERRGLGR
jgi:hypothetical protein